MATDSYKPLIDRFGRRHTSLRLSVTDRCNIRCTYCMPASGIRFLPRAEILSFEEITQFVRAAVGIGVTKLRITGGEPLVRSELATLIAQLSSIDGITDLALTTNAILLADQAAQLRAAGLQRINISLDSLREETFREIARREGLDKVLAGIAAAQRVGFEQVRLNAIALAGITEDEAPLLASFARERGLELRFIEFMPLDAEGNWQRDRVLSGAVLREILERQFGPLVPAERNDPSQPATDFDFADGGGRIGFINPVSQPFCSDCNRLRLTAEGQVRNCLFSTQEWDARHLLRSGGTKQELQSLIRDCVRAKKPGHGIDNPDFARPQRAMYQIGG